MRLKDLFFSVIIKDLRCLYFDLWVDSPTHLLSMVQFVIPEGFMLVLKKQSKLRS